jgi:hypothetical protein
VKVTKPNPRDFPSELRIMMESVISPYAAKYSVNAVSSVFQLTPPKKSTQGIDTSKRAAKLYASLFTVDGDEAKVLEKANTKTITE